MDHKEFFDTFAWLDLKTHVEGLTAFTVEELYQAIKSRLIDEVGVRLENVTALAPIDPPSACLIDTTEPSNER